LRALLQAAGEHEIGEVASILVLVSHGCDTRAAGNEMQGLLTPGLLFAGLHFRFMAREPVIEFDAQLGFE
jgi:hypothetical protein